MLNREDHIIKLQEFISSRISGFSEYMPAPQMMANFESPCDSSQSQSSRARAAKIGTAKAGRAEVGSAESVKDESKKKSATKSHKKAGEKEHFSISSFISSRFEDSAVAKQLNLYMHERDITTAMIYERCYIDRKLISKITNRSNYHPSKNTMLALCLGLQLSMPEAVDFLALGGFSFSNTSKFDLIIEYMLTNEIYDVRFVNEMLEKYDQPLLGA